MLSIRRPSAPMLVAVLALVLASAGSAGAARQLISGRDIKNASITGVDIKSGSVGLEKLSKAPPRGERGETGPQGATGATGPAGETGPAGATGATGPSNAWVGAAGSDTTLTAIAEGTAVTVATTTVTRTGPLLLLATLTASATGSAPGNVTCFIADSGGSNIGSGSSEVGFAPSGQALRASITVQAAITVATAPASFTLRCYNAQAVNSTIQRAMLTALAVGSLG